MRISGKCKIEIIEDVGGGIEIVHYSHTQDNLIPDNTWVALLGWNAALNFFRYMNISIATDTTEPIASNYTITGVIGTGAVVQAPTFTDTVEPPFGTYYGRINPVGVVRQFDAVALTRLSPADVQNTSTTAYAWLKLDIPCTQGENDYVNLTYSLQFQDDIGSAFVIDQKQIRNEFAHQLFGLSPASYGWGYKMSYLYSSFASIPIKYKSIACGNTFLAGFTPDYGGSLGGWQSGNNRVSDHFKWKGIYAMGINDHLGAIVNTFHQGLSDDNISVYTATKYNYKEEPFQTGFFHGVKSVVPFFDSSNPPNSQGAIALSGNWTNTLPEYYKITITDSGDATTAKYKLSVMNFVGFKGNSYDTAVENNIFRIPDYKYADGLHGWRLENFDIHRFSSTRIAQYDDTGVSVIDVISGAYLNYDATTTPALPVTLARQIAVDTTNKLIYVGCRATGLWQIDVNNNVISHLISSPCYGVDVGRGNIALAICEGGLYRGSNWSTPVPFTFVGVSDGNWSKVDFLKADPEDARDQILIQVSASFMVWYQFGDNSAQAGYNGIYLRPYAASIEVSDTGSVWVQSNAQYFTLLNYGTTNFSFNISTEAPAQNINHSIYGNSQYGKVTFLNNKLLGRGALIDVNNQNNNISIFSPDGFNNSPYLLILNNGVALSSKSLFNIYKDDNRWVNYGWDGANWVTTSTAAKLATTTPQPLINGLTIAFANGVNSPQFLKNEYFTQGVCLGLLKDNATDNLEFHSAWYSKSTHYATDSVVIPATAVYTLSVVASQAFFRMIDIDTPEIHTFKIAGIPVTHVWVDGTAPAVTEITLDSAGGVRFNAGDVGKQFDAYYLWIEV